LLRPDTTQVVVMAADGWTVRHGSGGPLPVSRTASARYVDTPSDAHETLIELSPATTRTDRGGSPAARRESVARPAFPIRRPPGTQLGRGTGLLIKNVVEMTVVVATIAMSRRRSLEVTASPPPGRGAALNPWTLLSPPSTPHKGYVW
jgi:hypothetical protein